MEGDAKATGSIRVAESDADLQLFARIRLAASPREWPVPPRREPDRLMLLWRDVGCGLAARSDLADSVTVQIYVDPAARRAGIGRALWDRLTVHARTFGRPFVFCTVDEQSADGVAFAARRGLAEVAREVEARRRISHEAPPAALPGIEVVTIAERPELLEAAWHAVGADGCADIPLPSPLSMTVEDWIEEEATVPDGSFVAIEDGRIVGYAGMLKDEHGLTTVARSHRGRGIATHLKLRQLAWASAAGVPELVSYTQGVNHGMRRVNEKLGYRIQPAWLKMQGPLPAIQPAMRSRRASRSSSESPPSHR
ncbi:GNAT family N-acetyltransferase [Actinoplanes sichuanensis]|uniref:GNAT family N-acetyltransferase n=1 Tax=Actinoplanes sichuanensis TaxID=512349 RepID=A0ABW4A090_9ACTN|nr:GNAT family N-acetyltransferase [Actinoplanes sichuanensis]